MPDSPGVREDRHTDDNPRLKLTGKSAVRWHYIAKSVEHLSTAAVLIALMWALTKC